MTEAELQRQVIDLAHLYHFRVAHFRGVPVKRGNRTIHMTPVGADGKGWVDLVLVRDDRILFRELKQDGRYPEPEQREWIAALVAAGCDVAVWRPKDLLDGTIQAELRRKDAA